MQNLNDFRRAQSYNPHNDHRYKEIIGEGIIGAHSLDRWASTSGLWRAERRTFANNDRTRAHLYAACRDLTYSSTNGNRRARAD